MYPDCQSLRNRKFVRRIERPGMSSAIWRPCRAHGQQIADPIFYFGVHWHIDKVFDDFKQLQSEQTLHAGNAGMLAELRAIPTKDRGLPRQFTAEQLQRRQRDIENSARLNPRQP